jgi:hypothetical protein
VTTEVPVIAERGLEFGTPGAVEGVDCEAKRAKDESQLWYQKCR